MDISTFCPLHKHLRQWSLPQAGSECKGCLETRKQFKVQNQSIINSRNVFHEDFIKMRGMLITEYSGETSRIEKGRKSMIPTTAFENHVDGVDVNKAKEGNERWKSMTSK